MRLPAFFLLLGLAGCGDGAKVRAIFGGDDGTDVLHAPDRVEAACAVWPTGGTWRGGDRFPMQLGPRSLDLETALGLAELLLDPRSYDPWTEERDHLHWVCHNLTVCRDSRKLEIRFRFPCRTLFSDLDGTRVGEGRFRPALEGELLRIFAERFPEDGTLPSVPRSRWP
jgi:hypothetical protein